MFVRKVPVKHGAVNYTYLRVVENERRQGRVVQKTVLNLGNLSNWSPERLETLVRSLSAFVGAPEPQRITLEQVSYGDCRVLGPYLPLAQLWERLGLDEIIRAAVEGRGDSATVIACAKAMTFTQLVAPRSKLATWQRVREQAEIPGVEGAALPLHAYYRALSMLAAGKEEIERALHQRVKHLFNQDLTLVFYDVTSAYFEGTHCPRAKHGYSREHRPDLQQIEIGLLVDAEGLPIGHEVFDGNVKDVTTVLTTLQRLQQRFQVTRCVFVGDDGMASEDNLREIAAAGYEYITSLSLGNSRQGNALLAAAPPRRQWPEIPDSNLRLQQLGERDGVRYLGSYHPERAAANRARRQRRLRQCLDFLASLQAPPKLRSRQRTPEQVRALAERFLRKKHCRRLVTVEGSGDEPLRWRLDKDAWRQERRQDGVLVLKTNSATLTDAEVVTGYRTLWRVEDAFRHLKDEIHLRPIRHWSDPRVAGHVLVCVLAYLLDRLYELELSRAGLAVTTRQALDRLASIMVATLKVADRRVRRRSTITPDQQRLLSAVGLPQIPELW